MAMITVDDNVPFELLFDALVASAFVTVGSADGTTEGDICTGTMDVGDDDDGHTVGLTEVGFIEGVAVGLREGFFVGLDVG